MCHPTPVTGEKAGRCRDLEMVAHQELLSGRAVSPPGPTLFPLSSLKMRQDWKLAWVGALGRGKSALLLFGSVMVS